MLGEGPFLVSGDIIRSKRQIGVGSEWHLSDIETRSQPRERIVARQAITTVYNDTLMLLMASQSAGFGNLGGS